MSLKVGTNEVRFSFPHVFEPHAVEEGDKEKYSIMILIPKSDKATMKKLREAEKAAAEKGVATVWGGKRPKKIASIIKDGDDEEETDLEEYPERAGHYYMNVRTDRKPQVVGPDVQPIMDREEIYSGCYGRVSINAFPYDYAGKKGVSFGLNNVQKTADGESLAGGSSAEDDFDVFEVDEDEDFDALI